MFSALNLAPRLSTKTLYKLLHVPVIPILVRSAARKPFAAPMPAHIFLINPPSTACWNGAGWTKVADVQIVLNIYSLEKFRRKLIAVPLPIAAKDP